MAHTNNLGLYPDTAALDHDAQAHMREAFRKLRASGVAYDEAIAALGRAIDPHRAS